VIAGIISSPKCQLNSRTRFITGFKVEFIFSACSLISDHISKRDYEFQTEKFKITSESDQ